MKTLMLFTTLFLLTLACGAFAADNPPAPQPAPTVDSNGSIPQAPGFTGLQMTPMFEEIRAINEAMLVRENSLLVALAAAETELEANRVIQKITRLEMDRDLAILRVQMHWAQLDGRYDLEREIKGMIVSLVNTELP